MKFQNAYLSVLIIAFLVSCGGTGLDQQLAGNIEVEGSTYEVYLVGSDSLATTGFFNYKRIELRENKNADPFLVIDSLDNPAWDSYAEFRDRNFDGYPDIAILLDDPAYQWNPFSLWLYDPEKKRFIYNSFMEYLPHDAYWNEDNKQVLISQFDHGETYTDSYYNFENGDFVVVKEEITIDGSLTSGLSVTTLTERVNGKMKVTKETATAGSLELRKSGSLTNPNEIKMFLEIFGDDSAFQPILKQGSSYKRYHETCMVAGFSIQTDVHDEWQIQYERFYPIIDWEEVYDSPDEMSSIEQLNYRANGNSFTLFMKSILENYDDSDEYILSLDTEIETITATFDKDRFRWVLHYLSEYNEEYYMPVYQANGLPMDDEECEVYEDY